MLLRNRCETSELRVNHHIIVNFLIDAKSFAVKYRQMRSYFSSCRKETEEFVIYFRANFIILRTQIQRLTPHEYRFGIERLAMILSLRFGRQKQQQNRMDATAEPNIMTESMTLSLSSVL